MFRNVKMALAALGVAGGLAGAPSRADAGYWYKKAYTVYVLKYDSCGHAYYVPYTTYKWVYVY